MKLTDISEQNIPYIRINGLKSDKQGFIIFNEDDEEMGKLMNPMKLFSWVKNVEEIRNHTLKLEIREDTKMILLRYLHLGKFWRDKYPIVVLEILSNFHKTQNPAVIQENTFDQIF